MSATPLEYWIARSRLRQGSDAAAHSQACRSFRVPFWGSVNPSPLGDGMRSIRNDANVEVGESYDMGL